MSGKRHERKAPTVGGHVNSMSPMRAATPEYDTIGVSVCGEEDEAYEMSSYGETSTYEAGRMRRQTVTVRPRQRGKESNDERLMRDFQKTLRNMDAALERQKQFERFCMRSHGVRRDVAAQVQTQTDELVQLRNMIRNMRDTHRREVEHRELR